MTHYGNDYSLHESFTRPDWTFLTQKEYSVYARRLSQNNGEIEYEGNCLLASIYETFRYFRDSFSLSNMNDSVCNIDPKSDPFYQTFQEQLNPDGSHVYSVNIRSLPNIYKVIREWFVDYAGYRFDSAPIGRTNDLIEYLSSFYAQMILDEMSDAVFSEISANTATKVHRDILCELNNDQIFHAMPIIGERIYQRQSGWWLFQHMDYVKLLAVNDNVFSECRYVDFKDCALSKIITLTLAI